MPLISVIMLSYNYAKYITESIESVLKQAVNDLELIIIDDASRDGSAGIAEAYKRKDKRVITILHKTNKGIARSVNDGLKVIKGKYVAFTSADDVWFHDKLVKQLEVIGKKEDLVVWSEAKIIDGNGEDTGQLFTEIQNATHKKKSGMIFEELLKGNFIMSPSLIVPKQILRGMLFCERLKYLNDWLFCTELAQMNEYYFMPEPLVKYRVHGKNTNTDIRGYLLDDLKICNIFFSRYKRIISDDIKSCLNYRVASVHESLAKDKQNKRDMVAAILLNPASLHARYYFNSRIAKIWKNPS